MLEDAYHRSIRSLICKAEAFSALSMIYMLMAFAATSHGNFIGAKLCAYAMFGFAVLFSAYMMFAMFLVLNSWLSLFHQLEELGRSADSEAI